MNTLLFIVCTVALVTAFYFLKNKYEKNTKKAEKARALKPTIEKPNDKLVIVNASPAQLDQAVSGFLELYNMENYQVLPRLYTISEDMYAFTFPFDISFKNFCFFVNYMIYPAKSVRLRVLGWATPDGEVLVKPDYSGKKCMFFIPEDDMEFDNVFLTSEDNICYEIGFEIHGIKRQNSIIMAFTQPQYTFQSLAAYPYKDLE